MSVKWRVVKDISHKHISVYGRLCIYISLWEVGVEEGGICPIKLRTYISRRENKSKPRVKEVGV